MRCNLFANAMERHRMGLVGVLLFFILGSCNNGIVVEAGSKKPQLRKEFRQLCGKNLPALSTPKQAKILSWMVQATGEKGILLKDSAQHDAACWMLYEDPLRKKYTGNKAAFLQRYALVTFFKATKGAEVWEKSKNKTSTMARDFAVYPGGKTWLSGSHECNWYGITCNLRKKVVGLELGFHKVGGLLPRELFLLTNLKELDLHGNDLQGVLPHKALVHWTKLQTLRLPMNGLFGSIHKEFGSMKNLRELTLFGNYMAGKIPKQLSTLTNLQKIDLFANNLSGTVPKSLSNLKKLRELDLHDNDFVGTMPKEICEMKLEVLVADCLGPDPEVKCDCCTICCRGLPNAQCVEKETGKVVTPT